MALRIAVSGHIASLLILAAALLQDSSMLPITVGPLVLGATVLGVLVTGRGELFSSAGSLSLIRRLLTVPPLWARLLLGAWFVAWIVGWMPMLQDTTSGTDAPGPAVSLMFGLTYTYLTWALVLLAWKAKHSPQTSPADSPYGPVR